MLRIQQLKLPLAERGHLEVAIRRRLELKPDEACAFQIVREALDARKQELFWVYTVEVQLSEQTERRWLRRCDPSVVKAETVSYQPPVPGRERLNTRPIVVGAGPAGLFAALLLAEQGYAPLLLERGAALQQRVAAVEKFWREGALDPENNVQFGEGGAGTFSDGKLNTQIRDPRIRKVMETFVACGASPEILYQAAPHLGTDRLRQILPLMRERLIQLGGEVLFGHKVSGLRIDNGVLRGIRLEAGEELPCEALLLAIGHSARDTYAMLQQSGVPLEAKAFSIGVRIEQLQSWIDQSQYGRFAGHPALDAAAYKLVYHTASCRTVYTFCMCPGGEVVAAASEAGYVATNGMSFAARNSRNANAALLVNVAPQDYGGHPLDGVAFQRNWEAKAFVLGGRNYRAPLQRVDDFLEQRLSRDPGAVQPSYCPGVQLAEVHQALPNFVGEALREALPALNRKLPRFADPEALLTGIESRSSAPLRILRDAAGESPLKGLFPVGEGAGYAGGIISAAVDGLRMAETIISRYRPVM